MTPSLQDLLLPGGLRNSLFPATSRYNGIDTNTLTTAAGRNITYLKRRFLPQPGRFALLQLHRVTVGERIDNITAQYLTDPGQYWRICDANNISNPTEAEQVGRTLRITLPQGVPGSTLA